MITLRSALIIVGILIAWVLLLIFCVSHVEKVPLAGKQEIFREADKL
jgi:uncharacterized integral membrane protein